MQHAIHGHQQNIFFMLDTTDKMMRISLIDIDTSETSFAHYFTHYFRRWISIFDAPVYNVVDRGTNFDSQYTGDQLLSLQLQPCPIRTEVHCSRRHIEHSHKFIHCSINKIVSHTPFIKTTRLMGEIQMASIFTQHSKSKIPHLHRFGIPPRIIENALRGDRLWLHHFLE